MVYVLLVNWNGWRHTVECLESLFRQDYDPFAVVVCDNGSEDGSLERLKAWARGELGCPLPQKPPLSRLFAGPLAKPIPFRCHHRAAAEQGGEAGAGPVPLVFIQTGANLGFGGGNNVGLRYILARGDARYVWLVNNDTVVAPDALSRLVARAEADPRVGAVGSMLLDYHRPEIVSSLCGKRLLPWLGAAHSPYVGRPEAAAGAGEPRLDYLEGASCLVPVQVWRTVGLFDPAFFHFWEDVDLCRRIVAAGYRLACEPSSRVYHKERASMEGASSRADYYEFCSGVIFGRKHFSTPQLWLATALKFFLKVVNRLRRRQLDRVPVLARALLAGLRHPLR
jgi:hypothetical protein